MSESDDLLHFEDFPVGETIEFGRYEVTAEEIKTFGAEFDPLPFHTDEEAAKETLLGGLSASGWHVCAMLMRMIYDGYLGRSASLGSNGIEEVRWLKPVQPGDILSIRRTTHDARVSSKRPEFGILLMHWEILRQGGEVVCDARGVNMVRVRGEGGHDAE